MVAESIASSPSAMPIAPPRPDVRLFVGGDGTYVAKRRLLLDGDRCFTAAHRPRSSVSSPDALNALLDSGAFSDAPEDRLTAAQALDRQLLYEKRASKLWGRELRIPDLRWQARYLVSYDRLIDETWAPHLDGERSARARRQKRRWSVVDAEAAVTETVDAAAYLASRRVQLAPRQLVLSCQGVDAPQYRACVEAVLAHAMPGEAGDWIGYGGWCIIGRWTTWLPTLWATLHETLPLVAARGVRHVHIFGVLYRPALGGLLALADRYGLTVSTDSSAPVLSARFSDPAAMKKSGVRAQTWEENVQWWRHELATLRSSAYYRIPPCVPAVRQQTLWTIGG